MLSAEQFKEIIASLRSDPPDRGSYEKRGAPRVGLRTRFDIHLDRNSKTGTSVWLRDISADGLGFIHSEPMRDETEFLVKYPMRGNGSMTVVYHVVHCKDVSKKLYYIGAKLYKIL